MKEARLVIDISRYFYSVHSEVNHCCRHECTFALSGHDIGPLCVFENDSDVRIAGTDFAVRHNAWKDAFSCFSLSAVFMYNSF